MIILYVPLLTKTTFELQYSHISLHAGQFIQLNPFGLLKYRLSVDQKWYLITKRVCVGPLYIKVSECCSEGLKLLTSNVFNLLIGEQRFLFH